MIWDEYSIQKPVSEDALPVYLEASPDSSLSNSCRNRGMCRSIYIDSRSCRTHSYLSTLRVIDEHTGTTLFHHGGHIYTGSFRGYLPAMSSFLTLETGFQHCLHERCFVMKKEKKQISWPALPHFTRKIWKDFLNSNSTSYNFFFSSFCEVSRGISAPI